MKRSTLFSPALLLFLISCGGSPSSALPSSSAYPIVSSSSQESLDPSSSSIASSEESSVSLEPSIVSSEESLTSEESSLFSSEESLSSSSASSTPTRKYQPLVTKKMEGLREDFIYGMDASAVPSLEKSGVKYRDDYSREKDVFAILAEKGITHVRVRIWNDPYDAEGHGYGGGNCDVDNAIAIGKRVTDNGMKLHVDFHYSDFWADPVKQKAPKAWATYSLEQKKSALYQFTKDTLSSMKEQGIDVGLVQVGNETNNGKMCGESSWENTVALMNEGSKATREVYPDALVAVHFTNPEKNGRLMGYAGNLQSNGLDYDVFGTSYYPYWHGTLDNLSTVLSSVASTYNKKVMVMETSYCYTRNDTDYFGNTSPKDSDVLPHNVSMQGQYDQVYDVIDTILNNTTNGIGVCYWEGTWISVNKGSFNANKEMWENNGAGWASSYASEYDPDDAGKWYGGCAVDNQAFFDQQGVALPSLDVFDRSGTAGEEGGKKELLRNGSFEGSTAPWEIQVLTENVDTIDTFVTKSDAKVDGSSSLNLWNNAALHFRLQQNVGKVSKGTYTLAFSVMGECSSYAIHSFALTSALAYTQGATYALSGWNKWESKEVEIVLEEDTDSLIVGLDIDFKSSGGWAYVDAASFI